MNTKDWILLIVPILCNGVIIFILQKIFERKQLSISEKYRYVSVMLRKVDDALALFIKVVQTTGHDQISWLYKFINSYCNVFYYYQQNQELLKSLKSYMDELANEDEKIKNNKDKLENTKIDFETKVCMESSFRKIYELLQSIQNDCINYKV